MPKKRPIYTWAPARCEEGRIYTYRILKASAGTPGVFDNQNGKLRVGALTQMANSGLDGATSPAEVLFWEREGAISPDTAKSPTPYSQALGTESQIRRHPPSRPLPGFLGDMQPSRPGSGSIARSKARGYAGPGVRDAEVRGGRTTTGLQATTTPPGGQR